MIASAVCQGAAPLNRPLLIEVGFFLTLRAFYVLVLFMTEQAARAERQSAMLGELAELGLSLARDLQRRALEAEAPEQAASLADAFHRVARSVRQSLALEARLGREAKRDAEDDRIVSEGEHRAAVQRRKAVLTEALERIVWTECEADEAEDRSRYLGIYIESEVGRAGFAEDTVEALVRRICQAMDLRHDLFADLPLAEICREAEAEVEAKARIAAAHSPAPPAAANVRGPAVAPAADGRWRSSA
jgi:hypothetical protein